MEFQSSELRFIINSNINRMLFGFGKYLNELLFTSRAVIFILFLIDELIVLPKVHQVHYKQKATKSRNVTFYTEHRRWPISHNGLKNLQSQPIHVYEHVY